MPGDSNIPSDESLDSVLVFGGCGFLGHHITTQLSAAADTTSITVFDIAKPKHSIPGVNYITGSITSKQDVATAFQTARPRVIFHSVSPVPFSQTPASLFHAVNVEGAKIVIECAQKCAETKAFVYTSSSSVIHNNRSSLINGREDSPVLFYPDQPEPYSHTKALAETFVLAANGASLRTVSIRPAGLFGEGDTGAVTSMITSAQEGKARLQVGDGKNVFDWTYVENCVHAQMLAARALLRSYASQTVPEEERVDGEAFNITNDEPWLFWDFSRALGAAAGYPVRRDEVIRVPGWLVLGVAWASEWVVWIMSLGRRESVLNRSRVRFLTMERTLNVGKARRRLGYRPLVGMQEGIERSAKWFLEEGGR
jgi:sterol-4alpha-carboxylate 3-dehydrogenase (decarboxylating)